MQTVTDFIAATEGGKIFTATFVKRTNGEVRIMNCRRDVTKHLKGGALAFDPARVALLPVFDMQAQGYRMIALDSLIEVKVGGKRYAFAEGAFSEVVA